MPVALPTMLRNCLIGFLIAAFLVGCGSSSPTVQRVDADTETDLSGRWNDTDARLVADAMIDDVLQSNWLARHRQNNDDRPTVIVGPIENRTQQHIDPNVFISDLERELINAGQVGFVAGGDAREAIRDERRGQQEHATLESAARLAQETGAEYMLMGTINDEVDESSDGRQISLFYVVNLELVNIETTEKDWIGTKRIKKLVERSRYSL